MTNHRLLLTYLAGIWSVGMTAYGQAPQTIVLPPVDLAVTETAEVNIMSSAASYPGWIFATTCDVSVAFYTVDGSAVGAASTFNVGKTAQIFSAELPFAVTGAKGGRITVSAQVTMAARSFSFSGGAPPIPPCALAFSLDTYDTATGVTHAFVAGQAVQSQIFPPTIGAISPLPCPQSASTCQPNRFQVLPTRVMVLPPVGLSADETAEVNIMSYAAGFTGSAAASCQASVTFYAADGLVAGTASDLLGQRQTHRAQPMESVVGSTRQIFSSQLPYDFSGAKGPRTLISATIALTALPVNSFPPGSTVPPCVDAFTLKTYDSATGVTHAFATGQAAAGQ